MIDKQYEKIRLASIAEIDRRRADTLQRVRENWLDAIRSAQWFSKLIGELPHDGGEQAAYILAYEYLCSLILQVAQENIDRERGNE